MTHPLLTVSAADPNAVFLALRTALSGGDALLPKIGGARAEPAEPTEQVEQVDKRVAVVIETSGSTGVPKRVALSADAMLASAAASDSSLGGAGQWLLALPTHYIAGLNVLIRSISAGTDPVILAEGHFDPARFVQAARQLDAPLCYTSVVPAQFARLIEAAEGDSGIRNELRRFQCILVGGQATPPGLIARAEALGIRVSRTYGSSETSGGCVYDGVPIGTARMAVVDGQVELSGPMLAEGYLADPARTDAAFVMRDGVRWYRTGDTGEIVDGILSVTGRLDGVIISGGVKVSLSAIETLLHEQPGLQDAVVVRSPHHEWGEVPVVFTTARIPLTTIKTLVVDVLGRASAPVAVITLQAIPVLASGKPDRLSLANFAASRGSDPR